MKGQKIFLRAVELNDVDMLYELENEPDIWHLSDTLMPFSRFALEQYVIESSTRDIYATKQLRLIIAENDSKKLVGAIDLYDFNPIHKRAGVGILITKTYRKKGYASDALSVLIHYAFSTLQLHQLFCGISSNNIMSIELFKKHNFIQTGCLKNWRLKDNNYYDELFFQLINPNDKV
ncbi:MAG: GNAT family protein [Bacteroidales bacterium]|mgnify:CR=1 FL=1|jgi:diamine N-acetyltransferase|nr:GNAT family protein [Bacteroidales bacterium]MDD2687531.1 GNAT family protein [Bacteroidales bacterium]MDD3329831.1 GNAT family protein [Bacteroidales bacterium]MDD3691212.1 GNAT family protein [Bacteroidales bacterium]MDD4043947.1 GNAT family protein [Bacteroidales bacterium]